ncbi:unnamed protein product [Phaedon cochleariae]|uniref:Uncharacterized protein n=1 Tax=Phaedon cochleariae TaxID=80249 RepID=A0A9P0DHF2_PHACE|nr:unnamed protein product [Phaedon cochleariae]
MSWTVVRFCETDEVEVLPCNWLQDGGFALYPPYGRSKLERAIKTLEEPNSCSWQLYKVKLMTKSVFNSFTLASAKASKACLTSDISDKEIDLPSKGPHKKKQISSDENSDTNGDSSESLIDLPSCPITKSYAPEAGSKTPDLYNLLPPTPSSTGSLRNYHAGTPRNCFAETPRNSFVGSPRNTFVRNPITTIVGTPGNPSVTSQILFQPEIRERTMMKINFKKRSFPIL